MPVNAHHCLQQPPATKHRSYFYICDHIICCGCSTVEVIVLVMKLGSFVVVVCFCGIHIGALLLVLCKNLKLSIDWNCLLVIIKRGVWVLWHCCFHGLSNHRLDNHEPEVKSSRSRSISSFALATFFVQCNLFILSLNATLFGYVTLCYFVFFFAPNPFFEFIVTNLLRFCCDWPTTFKKYSHSWSISTSHGREKKKLTKFLQNV